VPACRDPPDFLAVRLGKPKSAVASSSYRAKPRIGRWYSVLGYVPVRGDAPYSIHAKVSEPQRAVVSKRDPARVITGRKAEQSYVTTRCDTTYARTPSDYRVVRSYLCKPDSSVGA
jgi:hypothetical protein